MPVSGIAVWSMSFRVLLATLIMLLGPAALIALYLT